MTKRIVFAAIAVFVTWFFLDWVIHGTLLMPTYEKTASLWRPMAELKPHMIWIANALGAVCMVLIFALFFKEKNLKTGLYYGLLLGVAWGAGMGYGSYGYMPIPYFLAQAWFWAMVVEAAAAGVVIGLIVKD
jgi:hypothetical protein